MKLLMISALAAVTLLAVATNTRPHPRLRLIVLSGPRA